MKPIPGFKILYVPKLYKYKPARTYIQYGAAHETYGPEGDEASDLRMTKEGFHPPR
jgi:hypothetical protein